MIIKVNQDKRAKRHLRVRSKISGTSNRPRLVVFRSLKHISAQLVDDVASRTLLAATDIGQKIHPGVKRAEYVGQKLAEAALAKSIKQVVFDRGGYRYHGQVKALAESARAGGLEF
ncbi:MAG: 50S ribosomal protein L18 [bacterium]|nr:50S ribosomal protein L18 [bacterium]